MKVIVAGLPKTGTKTMQSALTELGYNVYDYIENFEFLYDEWKEICTNGGTTEMFRKMYENVDAVTDVPGCIFWDEILKAFPDAKIILTMRDTEDIWFKSFKKQITQNTTFKNILQTCLSVLGFKLFLFGQRIVQAGFGYKLGFRNDMNEMLFKMHYRRHNTHVIQNTPKAQLLVFNLKDGWGPLCEFLELPEPDTAFPHRNKNAGITEEYLNTHPVFLRMRRESKFGWTVLGLAIGVAVYSYTCNCSFLERISSIWS